MFWWTGCIGCGPTCGGRRGRSEPERAGGEQADARAGVLRRRRLAGKAAVEAVGVAAGALAVGLPRHWSCALGLLCVVAVPPTSPAHWRTVRTRPRQRRQPVSGDLPTNKNTGEACGDS